MIRQLIPVILNTLYLICSSQSQIAVVLVSCVSADYTTRRPNAIDGALKNQN